MSTIPHMNKAKAYRNLGILVLMFSVAQVVFAVDGKFNGGGSNAGSASFSHLKKDINFSLHENFSYRSNRSFGFRSNDRVSSFNSMMTMQRGNVTIAIPYRNKVVLPKFRTPSAPSIR
jgi:hypothetical protein